MKAMLKNLLHRYILILLLFFTLFYPLLEYLGFSSDVREASGASETLSVSGPEIAHYILILILFVLLSAFFFLKLKGKLIAGAGLLTLYLVNLYANGPGALLGMLSEYFSWVGKLLRGVSPKEALSVISGQNSAAEAIEEEAGISAASKLFIFQGIQILLLLMICFLLAYLSEKSTAVRYSLLALIFASGIAAYFMKAEVSSEGAAFWFTFVLFSFVEILESRLKKYRTANNGKNYLSMLWPVWILFLVIMLAVPKHEEPYDWAFIKSLYNSMNETFTRLFENLFTSGRDDFAVITSGFSETAELGENITVSNSPILHVSSDMRSVSDVYLTGAVMDRFNGRGWDVYTASGSEQHMDTAQLIYSVKKLEPEFIDNYFSYLELKIEFDEYATRHIFTPAKTRYLIGSDNKKTELAENTDMLWDRRMIFKDTYRTLFYFVNRNPAVFYELLSSDKPEDRELFSAVCTSYQISSLNFDDFLEYRKNMKTRFSEEIELTERTKNWLSRVTEGCRNDYEALTAIEYALKQFDYTLSPGSLPEDVDTASEFLDWFIFEKQEGYCTYFATAFTLLARSMGYPARYVQGFLLPMHGTRGCTINGGNSHAWSEVYFDNAGWITYEATPGYESSSGFSWSPRGKKEYEEPEYKGDFSEFARGEEEHPADEASSEQSKSSFNSGLILLAFMILLGLLALIFGADFVIGKIKYKKLPAELRYRHQMSAVLRLLDHIGFRHSDSDTLEEIKAAIPDEDCFITLLSFISEYEEVVYGGTPVSPDLLRTAVAARKSLLPMLGRLDRIREKYLLLKQ